MGFTVLGSSGFIGSHLVRGLRATGIEPLTPARNDPAIFESGLGHVIYCVGLTADFRARPYDTVRAHICQVAEILERCEFNSFLYLSSTRVYAHAKETSEDTILAASPGNADDLYNLSKMMGESLCAACSRPNVRVVRLSNVIGDNPHSGDFVPTLIDDAIQRKRIVLKTAPDSSKDYIAIDDVVALLPQIAQSGRQRIYNLASGVNLTNRDITNSIVEVTGCQVETSSGAPMVSFPPITVARLTNEFPHAPTDVRMLIRELTAKRLGAQQAPVGREKLK